MELYSARSMSKALTQAATSINFNNNNNMILNKRSQMQKKKVHSDFHALLEGGKLIYGDRSQSRSDLPGKMGRLTGRDVLG